MRADRIYLVGDIVDLQRMKSRPRFPDVHMQVVSALTQLARRGTEVLFIPGNHDHEFRKLRGQKICGIPVLLEAVHERPNGERMLVMHGDLLDARIRKGSQLEKFGVAAYLLLTEVDVLINKCRRTLGQDYLSLSGSIKRRISGAQEYIRRFELVAAEYAVERGFDGIVCGHIHRPNLRRIHGCLYANDGDWVEHSTALAESDNGELQLLRWQDNAVQIEGAEPVEWLAA
jgi:UDP-2,3-diacylglucosamine pyrophosphatase LpxH